jgi:hypothetical protein
MAARIMNLAVPLARRDLRELIVVHTWSCLAERALITGYSGVTSELEGWVQQAQDLHRRRSMELLRSYPLQELESQVHMLKGKPGQLIPELAARLEKA